MSRWPPMARAGLTPMARNAASIVAIEALAAAQACDFHAPLSRVRRSKALRGAIRATVPHLDDDRYFHDDIAAASGSCSGGR